MKISARGLRATPTLGAVALALALGATVTACGSDTDSKAGSTSGSTSPSATTSTPAYETATAQKVAGWLGKQVKGGVAVNRQYKIDDYSLSADIGIGLHAVDSSAPAVPAIAKAVATHLKAYVAPGFGTLTSAGAAAKTLVLEEAAGGDTAPARKTLEGTITASGPSAGRIADKLDPKVKKAADYSNTIGQALAVEGLAAAGSKQAGPATDFLLEQQCSAGWFRLYFTADPSAKDQSCDGDKASTPDVDVTAYAVLALASLDDPTAAQKKSLDAAVAWLASQEAADGSFDSAKPKVPNANSTGLAGWALGTAGKAPEASRAATWVGRHVIQCGPAAGAVAYDDAALAQGKAKGITVKTEYQFRLATAQALPVLQWLPAGAVKAGSC